MSSLAAEIGTPRKIPPLLLAAGIFAEILAVSLSLQFPIEVLGAVCGAGLLYFAARNTFAGICIVILLHYFVIHSTEEVSFFEVFFALCFGAVLGTWLFRKLFLQRQALLVDRSDYALLGFYIFCSFSIIPALLYGSSPLKWLREFIPLLTLLLVFPLRELTNSSRRIKIIIACFLMLGFAVAINNIFSYKQAAMRALQLWELLASRQHANEPLFMASIIVAGSFFVMAKSALQRLGAFLVIVFFGIALVITFSRGYWVGALLGLAATFWFVGKKEKVRMVFSLSMVGAIVIGFVFLFMGDLAAFVIKIISQRFQSVGEATVDLSFANRMIETQAVLAHISANPILGYGLGMSYSYPALIPIEMPTFYVHNTVLFLWYKVGIFGVISLIAFTVEIFRQVRIAYQDETDHFFKPLLLGALSCIVAMIVVSFSSPQIIHKDSALLAALICGLIQAVAKREKRALAR